MNVLLPRATGLVLDRWKVIYVITPELMGTSVLWMMAELQNEDLARYVAHSRAPEVTRALAVHDPAIWQQWFKPLHLLSVDVIEQVTSDDGWFRLGWTRHPVDRLWSAWQSKLLLREPQFVELYGTAQWFPRSPKELPEGRRRWWARRTAPALGAIGEDFERFVAALAQDPQLLTADPHWAPQSYLLRPEVFPYSEIGRIESAAVTLGRLERHLRAQGWSRPLGMKGLNATLLPRTVIRDLTLLRLIEEIYADDMIAFGYEPANVGHPPSADASAVAVRAMAEMIERHERIGDLHQMVVPGDHPEAPGGSPDVEQRKVHCPNEEGQDRRVALEICGVTQCPSDELIAGACIDYPRTGPVDRYAFEVVGWVVGRAPVAEVEFVCGGRVVACCELTVSRHKAAELYGSSSPRVGFSKAIGTVGLASDFTLEVRVVFQDGRRRMIAEIRGTQQLTSDFAPSMQPIIVNTLGRSGSTWLMRMLAEHPDIIVHERFPYETYVCSYWMHFLQLLATPVDTSQVDSSHFWRDPERLPLFPYCFGPYLGASTPTADLGVARWYATDQVEEFARAAQAAVESFYREYASSRKRTTPTFFAEKSVQQKGIQAGQYNWTMRQLYPRGREIFLLRDPRDTLASVLAFNARRGFDDFGRELVETDEQYIDVMRTRTLSFVQTWKSTSHRGTLVRYEDLVRSPTEQVRAILGALELDSSANIVAAMVKAGNEVTADVNAHRTSSDGLSSVGRWKRDLEPRLQKLCGEAFDGLLAELDSSSG